jgi:hypothetical protein
LLITRLLRTIWGSATPTFAARADQLCNSSAAAASCSVVAGDALDLDAEALWPTLITSTATVANPWRNSASDAEGRAIAVLPERARFSSRSGLMHRVRARQ